MAECEHRGATIDMGRIGTPESLIVYRCRCGVSFTIHVEETPISPNHLPKGPRWESDGSCWVADVDFRKAKGWRWVPRNLKALTKTAPDSPLADFVWPIRETP